MASKLTFAGGGVCTVANSLVILNDGPRRGELVDLCTAMGWQLCDAEPRSSRASGRAAGQITEFLARQDSPRRCVLVGYGETGVAALSAAHRHPMRVTAVVAIDVPFDGAVRSHAAKLACPVMILPRDDPWDVVAAVAWFLSKRVLPPDGGAAAQGDFRF